MLAYLGSDHVVRLTGASTTVMTTGETTYLNAGATVTFRVQTLEHVDVDGEAWPVQMTYIEGSDGDFIGVLRDTVDLDDQVEYRFLGTVENGLDQRGTWELPLLVVRRLQ